MDKPLVSPPSASSASTAGVPPPASETNPFDRAEDLDRLLHALQARFSLGLAPNALALAFFDWGTHLANAPARQLALAEDAWRRLVVLTALGFDPEGRPVITPPANDHRFASPAWERWPARLFQQGFLLAEEWWQQAACGLSGVVPHNARIVAFAIRQWLDAFAPSNIPWLNPEVIETTVSSGGRNLIDGFSNLIKDIDEALRSKPAGGRFVIGRDLAASPGQVVLRNPLMELIQYTPSTPEVRPEPVLIVPAWIMKYYILDLSRYNSLIRYLVGQGFTVFAISWRNPGPELRDTTFDDYRRLGVMAALDAIRNICGQKQIHACGYCIGGTLLAIAAAAMARDGEERLATTSLLAAQTDFTEAGELQLFITPSQLAFLDDLTSVQGYLDSRQMAGAFQMLRANDLLWSRGVKNYLLGVRDTPNDLMTWNADGTRLPAKMHSEYLTYLFLRNDLAQGRFLAAGKPVVLRDMPGPFFIVGTETDHVAPWRSVYKLHLLNAGDLTFVLTSGGHNAGIVSEPGHPHRHFRLHRRHPGDRYLVPEEWFEQAELCEGSWWPIWAAWLAEHSGALRPPPRMGLPGKPPLAAAPGTYVLER